MQNGRKSLPAIHLIVKNLKVSNSTKPIIVSLLAPVVYSSTEHYSDYSDVFSKIRPHIGLMAVWIEPQYKISVYNYYFSVSSSII